MKTEIKVVLEQYPHIFSSFNGNVIITKSPLMNCQTYSIGGMCSLLDCNDNIEILKDIQNLIKKSQLLIDINQIYEDKLNKIFKKEDFIFKTEYVNSTGSKMIMCLIKTDSMK